MRRRACDEDVLGLDISVEKVVGVYVVKTRQNLEENALYTSYIHAFVISGLHELIQIAVHVLHADVQFLAVRVEENVEGTNEMGVCGQRFQKNDFSEFVTRREGFEGLFHGFDGDLQLVRLNQIVRTRRHLPLYPFEQLKHHCLGHVPGRHCQSCHHLSP